MTTMFNHRSIIVLALIGLQASLQLVLCQQNAEDGQPMGNGGGGGHSRTLYSHPPLSPHRMMHFGKRLAVAPPSSLLAPDFVDLYSVLEQQQQQQQQQRQQQQQNRAGRQHQLNPQLAPKDEDLLPYTLLVNGEPTSDYETVARDKQFKEIVDHLLKVAKQGGCQTGGNNNGNKDSLEPKLMKLINSDGGNPYEIAAEVERQQQQQGEQASDQQQQQDADKSRETTFNVVGRSLPRSRLANEQFDLSKAHISSLLFGRKLTEPPSTLTYNYIKKAEPARPMAFMHFG